MIIALILLYFSVALADKLSYCEYHKQRLPLSLSLKSSGVENILLPFNGTRTPGSPGSMKIQNFIKKFFSDRLDNEWSLEIDSFHERGFNFTNLVFTPFHGEQYLVLAAHYDTKIEPEGFIGATDSGASCAILLYIAEFIDTVLTREQNLLDPLLLVGNLGLKIVFFDGEEAIEKWTREDSIYGAKHLAGKWENQGLLDRIDLFVLLDLLGSEEQLPVHSYHRSSHPAYQLLSKIEHTVSKKKDRRLDPEEQQYLHSDPFLDDDHRPFYEAGIPVLHLIPFPFPSKWHTLEDNFDYLDENQIRRWAVILCEFVLSYIG